MRVPENKKHILFGGTFVLANKLQAVADQHMEGLSTKQWFLLRNLRDMPIEPPPTITALAQETDTTRQNVRKMLEVLQRQGCVALSDSALDRRSQTVTLTEQGKAVLQRAAQAAAPFFAAFFSGVSEAECAACTDVMLKLIENLTKMQEGAK